jgi:hypothetical protein
MRKFVLLPLVFFLAATAAAAPGETAAFCNLPASIVTSGPIRRQIAVMMQRSATFRQQCQRLDVARLSVQIQTDATITDRPFRARTRITRSSTGTIAWVRLAAFGDPTEWLAHEFEHIIEQLDGVDLPQLAALSRRDAWCTGENMFETARAQQIGRLVVQEVRAGGRALARALKLNGPDKPGEDQPQ